MNFKIMLQILGIVFLIWVLSRLFNEAGEPVFKVSKDSDCSHEFIAFSNSLGLKARKRKMLSESKRIIQEKIVTYFKGLYWKVEGGTWSANPTFFIQGSFKHGTSIRTQQDVCDVDLGVYFNEKPPISPAALQKHLYQALFGHTSMPVVVKRKCVRVNYSNLFHIDLPIYYHDKKSNKYFLGVKDEWIESDPKEFTSWIAAKIQPYEQMIRLIQYFKAWTDNTKKRRSQKMPSGVALTVWVQEFYVNDKREDLTFIKTAYQMFKHLSDVSVDDWKCLMPVKPFDNLVDKLTEEQRGNFLERLGELIKKSESILAAESKDECVRQWAKIFGKWFTIGNETPLV
jgi:hypothetical protein